MSGVLLSICIPTRRRPKELGELLESLISQHLEGVEIIVADNGSREMTAPVVMGYQERGLPVRVVYNNVDKGFGMNVVRVLEESSGEFCWLMGDDDLFAEGALNLVKKAIVDSKPQVLLVDVEVWNHNFSVRVAASIFGRVVDKCEAVGMEDELIDMSLLTFVGASVFRRDPVFLDLIRAHAHNGYAHVFGLLGVAGRKIAALPRICVRQRMPLERGWNAAALFFGDLEEVFECAKKLGIKSCVIRRWRKNFLCKTLGRSCVGGKIQSERTDWTIILGFVCKYGCFLDTWTKFLPLYMMPIPFLRFLKRRVSWNR